MKTRTVELAVEALYTLIVTIQFLLPGGAIQDVASSKYVFQSLAACAWELTNGLHFLLEVAAQSAAPLIRIKAECVLTVGI